MSNKDPRTPPHSAEAEMALLGAILINPNIFTEIIHIVDEKSFYINKHKVIFEAMRAVYDNGNPIDLVTVTTYIKDKKLSKKIGGIPYLTQLAERVPTSANAIYYANQIAEKHLLRELIDKGTKIVEYGYTPTDNVAEVLDKAEKEIFSITQAPGSDRGYTTGEIIPQVWETIQRLQENPGELRGIPTGFRSLDKKLSGFQRSDLIILAARPSVGKTSLALNMAIKTAISADSHVVIFSLEMSKDQLLERMLAIESGVNLWKIRAGAKMNEDDMRKIAEAVQNLDCDNITIMDDPGCNNIISMRSVARRVKREFGKLDLIIVDYLQLMSTTRRYESTVAQVTEISRSLKGLARELDVPVLALSQLSRAVESRGGRPRLSDLRDSGSIEQDADVVMFLHREDKNKPEEERTNIVELLIEKHRNGPTGKIELYFDDKRTAFLELTDSDYDMAMVQDANNDPFEEF